MTKNQIKKAAKIYAASVVYFSMDCGAFSELLTVEQNEMFYQEVKSIANRMNKMQSFECGIDECIQAVIK